jgi:hypothetical protein
MMFLFLFIVLVVLGTSHYFIYFSAVNFLNIVGMGKAWLALVIALLPISFIVSSIFAHYYYNFFTKAFYFVSGLWLALAVNLILAFSAIWIIAGFAGFFHVSLNLKILFWIGAIFSFIFMLYGIWSAYDIKIKNIDVEIKNLPAEWQNKKAVMISDVHLGYINGKDFLENVVNRINILNPDIIFIVGDLFDGLDGHLDDVVSPINELGAKNGIYFVTGNHENILGIEKAMEAIRKTKIKVLSDEMAVVDGMQILGISFQGQIDTQDLTKTLPNIKGFNSAKPSVLLYHSPIQVEEMKKAGVSLYLAGHTHRGQFFPFEFITSLIYKGYDYGLRQEGDFSIYTSDGVGTWGPTVRTSQKPEIVLINFKSK